jgi:GNAT superfamily N-acetyltransferase
VPVLPPPVVVLQEQDHDDIVAFYSKDPIQHVYQLGRLEQGSLAHDRQGTWTGCRRPDGQLRAVLYSRWALDGGAALNALPSGEPAACTLLGQRLRRRGGARMVVGDRAASDALWLGMQKPWYRISYNQRLYVCDHITEGPELPVEVAGLADVDDLVPMNTGMLHEDLQVPLEAIDDLSQWAALQRAVSTGRILVVRGGTADHPLRFCIDIGDHGSAGAQVGGTYVPPPFRGKGIATAAMRGVCRFLFERFSLPRVTLHVHEANLAAVRCYERTGFVPHSPFRMMVR